MFQTEKLRVDTESGFWRLVANESSDEYFFKGDVKGLRSLLLFAHRRGWAEREQLVGDLNLEEDFFDERGRCTISLSIESNRIVVKENPDWSSGETVRNFSKTLDSLAYALTFLS